LKITAIAGGVGGARMADGFAQVLSSGGVTVIVNVGDDFDHFGLRICPDLDTVCYTLAGLVNPQTGWGRAEENWEAMGVIRKLGGPDWFNLGDSDLGLHLERTRRMGEGQRLSTITQEVCKVWGITAAVLPVSDDPVPTWLETEEGLLPFQEYFVRLRCEPPVSGFRFAGVDQARPAPGVLDAINSADAIVFCPSNPWVSIDPVLAIPGVKDALVIQKENGKRLLAVSPIIGGQTVKGPAAKMYRELGISPSALVVAAHYGDLLTDFVFDSSDRYLIPGYKPGIVFCPSATHKLDQSGLEGEIRFWDTDILMKDRADRRRLAAEIMVWLEEGPAGGKA